MVIAHMKRKHVLEPWEWMVITIAIMVTVIIWHWIIRMLVNQ